MNNRTYFLLLVFYVPTVLWGILAFLVYLSIIQQNTFLLNDGFFQSLLAEPVYVRLLILFASYLLAISIGLVFYSEKNIWSEK